MARKENQRDRSTVKPQGEDADFLVEEFGVEQTARARRSQRDPLAGASAVPEGGPEAVKDNDEVRKKPVVRTSNERSGAGRPNAREAAWPSW